MILLIARFIVDLILGLSRSFRPSGGLAVAFEAVYTVTDPPLRLLRRLIPPLPLGNVRLDLAFLVLFVVVGILQQQALKL